MDQPAALQHHAMHNMASHDVCPSVAKLEPSTHLCVHGYDECHCDMGCSMNAPMATLSEHAMPASLSAQVFNHAYSAAFSHTFLTRLDRPPQAITS